MVDGIDFRTLSPGEFAQLGWDELAYVKPVTVDGEAAWAVHAANGTEIALLGNRDRALALALEHDVAPVSVH
ncbi:MAG TPA: DUF1150 family protein [Alphaproteobacteria bacterium]|jgi:hypothetical protein|nr:DUF1150 family protein [Alphaproteobacteria bacterium]